MKYLFILGRNIPLSTIEILSYLEKENNTAISFNQNSNSLLVDVKREISSDVVERLGGSLAIGKVLAEGDENQIISKLDSEMLYFGEKNKINYSLWEYSEDTSFILDYLKQRFKEEKLKATLKHMRDVIKLQGGGEAHKISSKNLDEQYFLFEDDSKKYFGRIDQYFDFEELERRDMQKPVRREELAISPRIAKILINLSMVRSGGKIVDAFCGVGTILQEALLQGIEVVGVDKNKDAIKGAHKNMEWFGFDKSGYNIFSFDSKKVNIPPVNAMVSEPDLGETLRKMTTTNKAKETLREFENLMIDVINNLKEKISGRIVFTAPYIRTIKGRKECNIERIQESTGLKLVNGFPIHEYREKQPVGRSIYVLEKQ